MKHIVIICLMIFTSCIKERLNKYDINAKNGATDTKIIIDNYKIYKDDNGNGLLNVNETAYIQLILKNEGPVFASDVEITAVPAANTSTWIGVNNTIKVTKYYNIAPNSSENIVEQYETNLGLKYTLMIKSSNIQTVEKLNIKINYCVSNNGTYSNNCSNTTKLSKTFTLSIPIY